jgi:phosphatidylserine decarboxylase
VTIRFVNRETGEAQLETPPAEKLLKFLYENPFGKKTILTLAKRKFISKSYGKKMDKPSSTKKGQNSFFSKWILIKEF